MPLIPSQIGWLDENVKLGYTSQEWQGAYLWHYENPGLGWPVADPQMALKDRL
jgi:hypothetical protein